MPQFSALNLQARRAVRARLLEKCRSLGDLQTHHRIIQSLVRERASRHNLIACLTEEQYYILPETMKEEKGAAEQRTAGRQYIPVGGDSEWLPGDTPPQNC